jgi:chromosome segregation ATPase
MESLESMKAELADHIALIADLRRIKDEAQTAAEKACKERDEIHARWKKLDEQVTTISTAARVEGDRAEALTHALAVKDRAMADERLAHTEQLRSMREKMLAAAQEAAKARLEAQDVAKDAEALKATVLSLRAECDRLLADARMHVPATLSGDKD